MFINIFYTTDVVQNSEQTATCTGTNIIIMIKHHDAAIRNVKLYNFHRRNHFLGVYFFWKYDFLNFHVNIIKVEEPSGNKKIAHIAH